MIVKTGKFEGSESEHVVLKHGDYVQWYIATYPDSVLGREFKRLVHRLDQKMFSVGCRGCSELATGATAYQGADGLDFWCDVCDPYGGGAVRGKLSIVKTYDQVVAHIDLTANGNKSFKKAIVLNLAKGKGLPKRVTAQAAIDFFK